MCFHADFPLAVEVTQKMPKFGDWSRAGATKKGR